MAKNKEKDLNDGMQLASSAQGTAKTVNERGKWSKPSSSSWVSRINSRIAYLEENDALGRKLVLNFYNGKINAKDASVIADENELIENSIYPLPKSYVDTLKPNLFFRNPQWLVKGRRDDNRFAKIDTSLLNYAATETYMEEEIKACVHESILYGTGAMLLDFDKDRSVARARQVNLEDIVVENPESWRIREQSWMAVRGRLNLEDAKIYFNNSKLTSNVENSWAESPNFMTNNNRPAYMDERETIFEFWQVFAKYGQEREMYYVSSANTEEFLSFRVYDEEKADEEEPFKWVKKSDWPFVLDKEDFPIEFLMLSERTDKFYGQNEMAQYSGLMLDLNIHYQAMNLRARKAATAKIIISDEADEDQIYALQSGEDFHAMTMKMRPGSRIDDLIKVFEFPGVSQDQYEHFFNSKRLFDESSGLSELMRGGGGTGRKTATQANIESEQAGLKIASKQSRIDKFLVELARKLRIINAQMCPSDVVKEVVNDESIKTGVLEPNEQGVVEWDERALDPGRIIKESTVEVEINSARRRSSSENIALMSNLLAQISQLIDPVTQQPILGGTFLIEWARALAKEGQLDNIDELIPRAEDMQARQEQAQQAQEQAMEEEKAMAESMAQEQEDAQSEERMNTEASQQDEEIARIQDAGGVEDLLGI